MEIVKHCIEHLKQSEIQIGPSTIYSILVNSDITIENEKEFKQQIIPEIYELIENGKIRKEILFISLLLKPHILKILLEHEAVIIKLDLRKPMTPFDFVYYENKHWLSEVIESVSEHSYLRSDIHTLLLVLKIISITNSNKLDIQELKYYLGLNYEKVGLFYKIYLENLELGTKVVEFIESNSTENACNIFKVLSENSLLNSLSEMVNISNPTLWNDIFRFLVENQNFNKKYFNHSSNNQSIYTDEEKFVAFTILISIINCLKVSENLNKSPCNKDNITSTLEEVKEKLINLKNRTLQIELLEDIFALIFLRNSDIKGSKTDSFFCGESEIRLILSLLKSVFEELKKQYSSRGFSEFKRFVDLNKHITDGYWRLELLSSIKKNWYLENDGTKSKSKNILYYMLSSPEGLINMCLKQNNIEKAIQVVKIFGLEQSALANEIEYSIAITELRKKVNLQQQKGWKTVKPTALINNHVSSSNTIFEKLETEASLSQKAIDTLDIIMTVPFDYPTLQELINIVEEELDVNQSLLPPFYQRMKQMKSDNYYQSNTILLSCNSIDVSKFDEEYNQYEKLAKVYDNFQAITQRSEPGALSFNHPLHKLLLELQEICTGFKFQTKDQIQYMHKLLKYLKAFSKIFLLEQNNTDLISKGCDASLLEILKHQRVDLISKLIYERHVDGVDFDYIFGKMKLDLTYHIAACSFPKVNLNRNNANWKGVPLFRPRRDVVGYIQKRNWLLAFMINKIHGIQDEKIDSNEIRIRTLGNLIQLKDVQNLKSLFNDNEMLTVLNRDFCTYITDQPEVTSNEDHFYPILLQLPDTNNWKQLYDLISSISEIRTDAKIQKLCDLILCNLIKSREEHDYFKYIRFITNREIRLEIILAEMQYWPAEFCLDIIKFETSIFDNGDKVKDLQHWYKKIQLYVQMKDMFETSSWFEIHQLCKDDKNVISKILETYDIDILINYLEIHPVDDELLHRITTDYFIYIFNQHHPLTKIKILLDKLPEEHFIYICKNLLKSLKNLENLAFVLNCLKEKAVVNETNLQNLQISLKMLKYFTPEEQQQYFCLMGDPLSILEMLLMNTKLEKLGNILQGVENDIKANEEDDNIISVEKIDKLIRTYGEKSVDFRVITRPSSTSPSDSRIMQSIDSLCLEQKMFAMPEKVPTKEEWISDDNVTECMCCYQITFSMFNRRHHCRRCGRVICWNCSLQKMLVESYGDILVRVCKDCYKQSRSGSSDSDSMNSERSRIDDFWILTDNLEHNAILRQEFLYENAPSVLLCLSILKYHSKSDLCPKFLLTQCENILQILHPIGTYYEVEIDFNLIINMLKSLAVAAKMISNQSLLQWGASKADKMISQAEMLGLLAEKGYLHLLSSRSQNVHIDANVLRHVRDKLLELEQWHLALEVSTKAGLDTAGVFAKWGKSFLRAGNLQMARLKFHMCFEKCTQFETPDYSNFYESHSSLRGSTRSLHQSKLSLNSSFKPSKSPLLLNEIIQILEAKTERVNIKVLKSLSTAKPLYDSTSSLQSNPASSTIRSEDSVSIISKLQSLNAIANGNFLQPENCGDFEKINGPHLENIYYEECIYYLEKYGSHLSLCQFYIRHNDFRQTLEYIIENEVNTDVFIEIYMTCLKHGRINHLQEIIFAMDPTLDIWKNYIRHICIYLEKQCMLHSLYQLQQFIGDFVRAAMTCIKFYSHEISCFEEFRNRVQYLQSAHVHLKQELEQEQWVDVQSVSSFQSSDAFEEKSISNPALVMKMNPKEVSKHLNTIQLQIEAVEFLTICEQAGTAVSDIVNDIQIPSRTSNLLVDALKLPTLFGSTYEKMQLAILCVVSGQNVEDGFGIAYKIINDYKLKASKIYCQCGRLLAKAKRYSSVPGLVKCIRSGGEKDSVLTEMCDEMLALTAKTLGDHNATDKQLEDIIKHISNRTIKINSYIETKQLRSAFLLAAKFGRISDIRRISREAEIYNRPDVKKLCQKYLQIQDHVTSKSENS